jgi:hypothetical protein
MSFLLLNSCNFRYNLVSIVIFVSEEKSRTINFVYGLQQQTFLNTDAEECFLNCRFHSTSGVMYLAHIRCLADLTNLKKEKPRFCFVLKRFSFFTNEGIPYVKSKVCAKKEQKERNVFQ